MHELSPFFRENRNYRFLCRRIYAVEKCDFYFFFFFRVEVIKDSDVIANDFYKKIEYFS